MNMDNIVEVAVGVIYQQARFFLTKRHVDAHQGGKWEFPGGKVETAETVAQALARELKEEIAIDVLSCQPLVEIRHDYGDKKVQLSVFLVDNFTGEPTAQEGQEQGWFALPALVELDFPEANQTIINALMALDKQGLL